jgi:hypothetical protein
MDRSATSRQRRRCSCPPCPHGRLSNASHQRRSLGWRKGHHSINIPTGPLHGGGSKSPRIQVVEVGSEIASASTPPSAGGCDYSSDALMCTAKNPASSSQSLCLKTAPYTSAQCQQGRIAGKMESPLDYRLCPQCSCNAASILSFTTYDGRYAAAVQCHVCGYEELTSRGFEDERAAREAATRQWFNAA